MNRVSPDHHRVDGGHRHGAAHVVHHGQPGGVPGPVHAFRGLGPQRADQPGPDPLPVLDQEEHDEEHQHQAAEELGGDLAAGDHGALDEGFVLAEVAGNVVQGVLDVAALDVEGRAGEPRLHLRGGVPGLIDQGGVIGADPVGDQQDDAAEYQGRDQQRAPGRGQAGQPGSAQPGRQRLQQGGEQERRGARHDHDVQHADHAGDQVEGGGEQQQPPRPGGPGLQPARHPVVLGGVLAAVRDVRPGLLRLPSGNRHRRPVQPVRPVRPVRGRRDPNRPSRPSQPGQRVTAGLPSPPPPRLHQTNYPRVHA